MDDDQPRVRPDNSIGTSSPDNPRGRGWTMGIAAALAVIAAAVIVTTADDRPEPESVATTSSTMPVPTTTSTPSSTSTTAGPTLRDLLPDVDGKLVVAINGPTGSVGLRLTQWRSDSPRTSRDIPMLTAPVLEFDGSGQYMAFLGHAATLGGATLNVGDVNLWAPAEVGVSSFRWHSTIPGRIAWLGFRGPPSLCWADVLAEFVLSSPTCMDGTGEDLLGFDSGGFIVADYTTNTVSRVDHAGRVVGSLPGVDAKVGPDGRVLVIDYDDETQGWSFALANADLSQAGALGWAPENALGENGFVAWSPVRPDLAFLIQLGGSDLSVPQWRLDWFSADGTALGTADLRGRVWDVKWDSTGRYLIAPGVLDPGEHVVRIIDIYTQDGVTVYFDNWVQDAQLVTEAPCEDATEVIAAFPDHLYEDVLLASPWMVLSRDAGLESWYFVSARMVGGPHDGALATWALPGFPGEADENNTPGLSVPINEPALSLGFGMRTLDPIDYGVDDWFRLDGALASQWCIERSDLE